MLEKILNCYRILHNFFNEEISKHTQTIESKVDSLEASVHKLNSFNIELSNIEKEDSSTINLNYNNHQIDKFTEFNNTIFAYYIKIVCILSFLVFLVFNFIKSVKETPDINFNLADIQLSFNYSNIHLGFIFPIFLWAFSINIAIAFFSHLFIYKITIKNKNQESKSEDEIKHLTSKDLVNENLLNSPSKGKNIAFLFNKVITFLSFLFLFLFSPDLFYAKHYKSKLKSHVQLKEKNNLPAFLDNEKLTISHWNTIK